MVIYLELNKIYNVDFREGFGMLDDGSVDMIFTDPPYLKKYLYIFDILAKESKRVLKDGSFMVSYVNDYFFDICFNSFLKYLDFFCVFFINFDTGPYAVMGNKNIEMRGKNLVCFSKGMGFPKEIVKNKITTPYKKGFHKNNWDQNNMDSSYYITRLSKKGDVVLDPFVGSGTTAISCIRFKRNYLGFELNTDIYLDCLLRIRNEYR